MKRPSKATPSTSSGQSNEIYLTTDGGVRKTITSHGTGPDIPPTSYVTVHYILRLEDDTIIDSSRSRNSPFSFQLGSGAVILGWEKAIKTMKKGEKALIRIEADYGYGNQTKGPIPANSTLFFEVEMIDAQKEGPSYTWMILMLVVITVFLIMTFNYLYPKSDGNIGKAIEGLESAIFGGHAVNNNNEN